MKAWISDYYNEFLTFNIRCEPPGCFCKLYQKTVTITLVSASLTHPLLNKGFIIRRLEVFKGLMEGRNVILLISEDWQSRNEHIKSSRMDSGK